MKRSQSIILLFTSFILFACASTGQPEVVDPNRYIFPELEEVTRISEHRINSWTEVDKQSLIINSSPSKSYLVILKRPSSDLKFGHAISFGRAGPVYSNFDRIYVINTLQEVAPIPIAIDKIYRITDREQKKKIIASIRGEMIEQISEDSIDNIDISDTDK